MDFSKLKTYPWNETIYLAQQNDVTAMRQACHWAEPIADQFCKVSYFVRCLGKDETRSIATLSLAEFIMSYPGGYADADIPANMKQAIKCDLINSIQKLQTRRSKEEPYPLWDEGAPPQSGTGAALPAADAAGEPEARLLQKRYAKKVQDAIKRLSRNEQAVIHSFFFRQDSTAEIAAALGCTPQYVSKIKHKALRRLRGLLKRELAS